MKTHYVSKLVVIQPTAVDEWLVCLTSDKDTYVVKVCYSCAYALWLGRRIARLLGYKI